MVSVYNVSRLGLSIVQQPWTFADDRRKDIDAHFAEQLALKPTLFNGRVFLLRRPVFDAQSFSADYFETDFASFLAWRDWGFQDKEVFNGFGGGALRSADGYFLLGRMAEHTANAGRVYFPAGTPDLHDIVGNKVDLDVSIGREVEEEVGLTPSDYAVEAGWTIIHTGQMFACYRMLQSPLLGVSLRDRITTFLQSQELPELDAVRLVRHQHELGPETRTFARALIAQKSGFPD